ncbi:MAG: response regulator [bacterium]|nr:response regulator [bacterium]
MADLGYCDAKHLKDVFTRPSRFLGVGVITEASHGNLSENLLYEKFRKMEGWATSGSVYIVDDDSGARESVEVLVTSMGLEFRSFASGEDFLDFLNELKDKIPGVCCALVDVRMRGMSGTVLLKELRKRDYFISIPIILVTAFADVPMAIEAMQNGAHTILPKPYRDQELWEIIVDAIRESERNLAEYRARATTMEQLSSLTKNEQEVLDFFLRGVSNKRIAYICDVSSRTVDVRRKAILHKMQVSTMSELIWKLSNAGYKLNYENEIDLKNN